MVLPFRRKGSGGKDDDPVDQDIEDIMNEAEGVAVSEDCLLYTSPSPRDPT